MNKYRKGEKIKYLNTNNAKALNVCSINFYIERQRQKLRKLSLKKEQRLGEKLVKNKHVSERKVMKDKIKEERQKQKGERGREEREG